MAFYSYLSTKIIMAFITKSYQNLFGVRSYINAFYLCLPLNRCLPVRLQIFVGTAEVLVAKETVIG